MVTYGNNKIYVGQDRTNDPDYFGSSRAMDRILAENTPEQLAQRRKDILWASYTCNKREINSVENHFIIVSWASRPDIGYNLTPNGELIRTLDGRTHSVRSSHFGKRTT